MQEGVVLDDLAGTQGPKHTLYMLTFASGKNYVGQTVRAMGKRLQQHRAAARRGSDLPVHCAWRKYGEPKVQLLAEFASHEDLHRGEIEAISRFGTLCPNGYNVSLGGDTAPSLAPVVARKIAEKARGRKHADTSAWRKSTAAQWQDPEYRQKVLDGLKASFTEERRAQMSERAKAFWEKRRAEGWTMPEETRAKIRQREFSAEARAKMSASAKRRGIPPEQRAKIVASRKGKPSRTASPERRASLSVGVKAAWADPVKRERLLAARKTAWETRRRQQQEAAQ